MPPITDLLLLSLDLGLSAASDTIGHDHAVLVRHIQISFCVTGPALKWLERFAFLKMTQFTWKWDLTKSSIDVKPIKLLLCSIDPLALGAHGVVSRSSNVKRLMVLDFKSQLIIICKPSTALDTRWE